MKAQALSLSLILAPGFATAAISYATQTWYLSYQQLSNSAPTAAYSSALVAMMGISSEADLPSATWSGPTGSHPDFIITPTLAITYSSDYGNNIAGFLADYPAGQYVFAATAGPNNGGFAALNVGSLDFANVSPRFTGNTYNNLQLCPAGVPQTLTWNTWTSPATDHAKGSYLTIVGYTVPGDNHYDYFTPSQTSGVVPGTALSSGRRYYAQIDFFSSRDAGMTGFANTVPVTWGFSRRTILAFSVDASPGTVAGQLTLGNFVRPLGEVVDWEVIDSAGTVLDSGSTALGYENWYAFNTTAIGNYRVRFKARHWLSLVTTAQPIATGVNFLNVTLTNGDVNGDNIVDIADYGRIATAFDSRPGDANYDEAADLDGNSIVDIADYSYLAVAFDLVGE